MYLYIDIRPGMKPMVMMMMMMIIKIMIIRITIVIIYVVIVVFCCCCCCCCDCYFLSSRSCNISVQLIIRSRPQVNYKKNNNLTTGISSRNININTRYHTNNVYQLVLRAAFFLPITSYFCPIPNNHSDLPANDGGVLSATPVERKKSPRCGCTRPSIKSYRVLSGDNCSCLDMSICESARSRPQCSSVWPPTSS